MPDRLDPRSFLFITLDSCRYDTFEGVQPANLSRVGPLYRAQAPSTFTYGSHAAMFVGFTPGVFERREPYINPKFRRVFKLHGSGIDEVRAPWVRLTGRSIVDGFRRLGHLTLGSGGVNWFNPATPASKVLTGDFDEFFFGGRASVRRQVAFLADRVSAAWPRPVFAFANIGETHVPYTFEGASWSGEANPCRPFAEDNDAGECRRRQRAGLEFVDRELGPLLEMFADANTLVCADHGDAWGEDGLWEHGINHPKVLEVPLLMRLQSPPA